MNVTRLSVIAVFALSITVSGCGEPAEVPVKVQSSALITNARKVLEELEKSGKMGSSVTALESDLNGIRESDSAKGDQLIKNFRELQGLTAPDQIKAKAKEMLGKL